MSHVMCHVSHVMCHMSLVTCDLSSIFFYFFLFFFLDKALELDGGGCVVNGPTPSSFLTDRCTGRRGGRAGVTWYSNKDNRWKGLSVQKLFNHGISA